MVPMLKRILLCLAVLLLFASQAFAENWTYLGPVHPSLRITISNTMSITSMTTRTMSGP